MILIFIGGVFLLENMGYLPPNFWTNLWRLWPLVLILIGIEVLFAQRLPWLALAGLAALVLVVGAAATSAHFPAPGGGDSVERTTSRTELGTAKQAAVIVRFGAGQLNVGPIDQPGGNVLATTSYEGPADLALQPRYTVLPSGIGQLEYQSSGRSGPPMPFFNTRSNAAARLELGIAPDVPITSFTVQTGATEAHLDFSRLQVSSIDMSVGAATATVRLPENAGKTSVHVSGGASTISLEVPQGVAAQIQHHGGLSTFNVNQSRFAQVAEGLYRSSDYDSAQNRTDITLETGVTTIQVN